MTHQTRETRGLIGSLIFAFGGVCLIINLAGVGRLAYDVVAAGVLDNLIVKTIILSLTFIFGLGLGALSQRRFENPAFPLFARVYGWIYLTLTCVSYLGITVMVNAQQYSLQEYGAYWLLLAAELGAIIGLRLVAPGRALGLFTVPMLAVVLFHLLLLVNRYVFAAVQLSLYLVGDLALIFGMGLIATTMLGENAFRAVLDRIIERTS